MDAELWKQPTADKRSGNSDDKVAYQTESGALDDLPGKPSGGEAHQQNDQ